MELMENCETIVLTSEEFFKQKCTFFKSILGRHAEVMEDTDSLFEGIAYVVDPFGKTFALVHDKKGESFKMGVFMAHAVKWIRILPTRTDDEFFKTMLETSYICYRELTDDRKAKVSAWLEKNRIDFTVEGDRIRVLNKLFIEYPYGPENCYSNNTIVLDRVRNLMRNMPSD